MNRPVFNIENTPDGIDRISKIRETVKFHNAIERYTARTVKNYEPKLLRVTVYGRLGKNNPKAHEYYRRYRAYHVPAEAASWFKVYVNPITLTSYGTYVREYSWTNFPVRRHVTFELSRNNLSL